MTGRGLFALTLCVTMAGCTAEPPREQARAAHFMPWRPPGLPPAPPPASGNLKYYGGHVLSNVKIYVVLWGASVRPDTVQQVPGFFQAVTNSSYIDYLNEYNTTLNAQNGSPGTQQVIGRGTYAGSITITPSATGGTIDDSQINAELEAQINAGTLPPPDADTLYMTYFPPGIQITQGNSRSCVGGGFCAYHSTFVHAGKSTFYGVMPDNSPGSGCDQGCGNGTAFQTLSISASHELTEAITDAEVGIAGAGIGPPIAWYDTNGGEIGDICAGGTAAAVGSYTVQKEWSNAAGACVAGRTDSNDFSVSLNPNTGSVVGSNTATFTVQTAVTAGSPGTLTLTAAGLPSTVTAAFSPASVPAGGTSTLTLSASSAATETKDVQIAVVATGQTAHSAGLLLEVKPPPPSDFTVTVAPSQLSFTPGSNGQLTVSTTQTVGTPGPIALSASGLPSGVTAAFNPATIQGGQTSTLTVSSTVSAATGTYPFMVTAQGAVAHSANATLTLVPGPSVQITSPANGATVNGKVMVSAQASNVTANANIQLAIDGVPFGSSVGTTFSQTWDSSGASNGTHTLQATVSDGGKSGSSSVTVTVRNPISVTVTSPAGGTTLSGRVTATAQATVAAGITLGHLEIYVDGVLAGNGLASPYTVTVDTTRILDGAHDLTAKGYDTGGDIATSAPVHVIVQNGTPTLSGVGPPTVAGGCGCGSSGALPSWVALLALAALGGRVVRRRV